MIFSRCILCTMTWYSIKYYWFLPIIGKKSSVLTSASFLWLINCIIIVLPIELKVINLICKITNTHKLYLTIASCHNSSGCLTRHLLHYKGYYSNKERIKQLIFYLMPHTCSQVPDKPLVERKTQYIHEITTLSLENLQHPSMKYWQVYMCKTWMCE